jgi:hypothetical protein
MSVSPFKSDEELLKYARWFLADRVRALRKDLAICMTKKKGSHAYFPALITCIGFADLLSGLHKGTLDYPKLPDLQVYITKFFRNKTSYVNVDILYHMFRHKIAHIAYPYLVFNTAKAKQLPLPHRRIVWSVGIYKGKKPIDLIDHSTPQTLKRAKVPWSVPYTCRIKVSLTAFRNDIISSIYGTSGYLQHLQNDPTARQNFAHCMTQYAPP